MKKEFKKTGEIKIVVYKELDKKSPVFMAFCMNLMIASLQNPLKESIMQLVY